MKKIFAVLSVAATFVISSAAEARCDCRVKKVSDEHGEVHLIIVGHGPAHVTIKEWYYRIENGNDDEMRRCHNLMETHSKCK